MIEFIETAENGDCTRSYNVILDRTYTVNEFISMILSEKKDEWGCISIDRPFTSWSFQYPNCKYECGKLTTKPFPYDILAKTIKEVKASGGWTRMDYTIII